MATPRPARALLGTGALAIGLGLGAAFGVTTPVAAAPTVVVAVDTSRSLSTSDLAAMARAARTALQQVPAATRVGVLGFNDSPQWALREGSVTEAQSALGTLEIGRAHV